MVKAATDPSEAALWSRAAAGITKTAGQPEPEEEPEKGPVVQEPKPDHPKRLHLSRDVADRVHAASDARLLQQMQARLQQEQTTRQALQHQLRQQQVQHQAPPPPTPNPIAVREALAARQQAQQARPVRRPQHDTRFERTTSMLTTGIGLHQSWKAGKKQKRSTRS